MEGALVKCGTLVNGFYNVHGKQLSRLCGHVDFNQRFLCVSPNTFQLVSWKSPHVMMRDKLHLKTFAVRRRRGYLQSDTYVLMEPGKDEEFVSEDELKVRLKGWLENWPTDSLPPDLAKYNTIDDAVSYLVRSVCELEIDGEVGSVQWFQVRLEGNQ